MRRAFALNSASAGDSLNVGAFFLNTSAGCLKAGVYFSNAGGEQTQNHRFKYQSE